MGLKEAEAEYERLKARTSTHDELWAGYWELVRKMDKINIAYYHLCDNDEQEEDLFP